MTLLPHIYHIFAKPLLKLLCFRSPPTPLHLRLCLWKLAKTSNFWASVSKPATGTLTTQPTKKRNLEAQLTRTHNLSDVPGRLLQLWSNVLELLCEASAAGNGSRPGSGVPLPAEHVQPHPLLPGGRRPQLPGRCRWAWSASPLPPPVRVPDAHAQIGEAGQQDGGETQLSESYFVASEAAASDCVTSV